jgi:hypothetical protein
MSFTDFQAKGQIPTQAKQINLPVFEPDSSHKLGVFIEIGFGKNTYKNAVDILKIYRHKIDSIYLIFSDFPKKADLSSLNASRFESIAYFFPKLDSIPIKIVRQTACNNREEAKNLKHGFYFFLTKPKKKILYKGLKNTLVYEKWDKDTTVLHHLTLDTVPEKILVCDLTASMSGHVLQVILWQIRENKRIKGLIVFNDGDSLPNSKKTIGKTGGIYYIENRNLDFILAEMDKVIEAGDGNDLEENNLEALLYAQKHFPNLPMIHISDSRPPIRDLSLADSLKTPMKIILARTEGYWTNIHTDFLDLALSTKSSLHFGQHTLTDPQKISLLRQKIVKHWKKIQTR